MSDSDTSETPRAPSCERGEPLAHRDAGWFIVSQVKSNRVVYFTDDPQYQPAMEGDWYYVSHFVGDLPEGMTLRNCWSWRFNGGVFQEARDPIPKTQLERLIESNREALLTLLREKIDLARSAVAPACALGDEVRRHKLLEARAFREGGGRDAAAGRFPLLEGTAVARNVSLAEAASLVEERHAATARVLETTEAIRERYAQAILRATTQEDLLRLRRELLDDVLPSLSEGLAFPAKVFEPEDWEKPLSEEHRLHEVTRLQVQLREIVNSRRTRIRSQYLEDDTLKRRKATLAQAVLSNAGRKPEGLDCTLLEQYAQAHRLGLADAARLVLGALTEAEQVLVRTEILKDSMLARIEGIQNLRDIRRVSAELRTLAEGPPSP